MRHDRASHGIGIALLGALCLLITVLLLGCKPFARAQEPAKPDAPEMPEVFYPQDIPQSPPQKYLHGTVFTIGTGSPRQVHVACADGNDPWPERVIFACTEMMQDVVLMPNPCLYWWEVYATLLCHEQGHVNGWLPNHPDE